jgi:hypothetical protein
MKRWFLCLLCLLPTAAHAAEAPAAPEEDAELRARLDGARAVPYLDDKGVLQGYIVSDPHSPDPSSLKLKKGDVLTVPRLSKDDPAVSEPE